MSGRQKARRAPALPAWRSRVHWNKVAVGVITALVMAVLFTRPLLPDRVSLRMGDVAPRDIVAHRYVQYPDDQETTRLRGLASRGVEPVYARVADAAAQAERDVAALFDRLLRLRQDRPIATAEELLAESRRALPSGLPEREVRTLARVSSPRLQALRQVGVQLAADVMALPLRSDTDDLQRAIDRLPKRLAASGLADRERDGVAAVVARVLRPNRLLDEGATSEARQREAQAVQPVTHEINRGEVIIQGGQRVTAAHMDKFIRLGLQRPQIDATRAVSLTLLAFMLVSLFSLYLWQFHPRILADLRSLGLIAVIATGSLLLFRLGSGALDLKLSGEQTGYVGMMSASLAAMLVAALLHPQVALFVGVCMALVTGLLVESQLKFAIIALVSSLVGGTAVANIRNRAGLLRAALLVAVANVITILIAQGSVSPEVDWTAAFAWGSIGAVGSVLLFVLGAALLERPFRLTTHLTLLELSDPNHPLLKRLSMEAPGTYAHSISVGNLSEAAAKAIGADSLFARVASYYHDIGKVVRPQFFVENQTSENRHTGMSASLSCLVVTAHVKDGIELAEQHRLPPPVIDIIREHHGTCLIKYFYHRAVITGGEDSAPALEYQFRYEGPRPRTKESGVIMLADAAEAASRSLDKPTPARIRDLVETIVRDRLSDAQLDDCELTFKDLEKIITSFTRSLSSMLHARVEYPAAETRELTRLAADGAAGKEPVATGQALADVPEPGAGAYPESA